MSLSQQEINKVLEELEGWSFNDNTLSKSFQFGSFREAMSFLLRVGFEAEEANHHPEIVNVYGSVQIRLTTHDAGNTVTEKDVSLARRIDHISWI